MPPGLRKGKVREMHFTHTERGREMEEERENEGRERGKMKKKKKLNGRRIEGLFFFILMSFF